MLNLSQFTHFSWGKIWFATFDLCKKIEISQLTWITTTVSYNKDRMKAGWHLFKALLKQADLDLCCKLLKSSLKAGWLLLKVLWKLSESRLSESKLTLLTDLGQQRFNPWVGFLRKTVGYKTWQFQDKKLKYQWILIWRDGDIRTKGVKEGAGQVVAGER